MIFINFANMLLIGVQHHQLEVVPVKTREYFLLIQLADNFQSWPEYGDIGTWFPIGGFVSWCAVWMAGW